MTGPQQATSTSRAGCCSWSSSAWPATQGRRVTVDVQADDDHGPGPSTWTASPAAGYPRPTFLGHPDATLARPFFERLSVPGAGVYTVNPGNGLVAFDPEPGFVGVSRVTLRVGSDVQWPSVGSDLVELATALQVTVLPAVPTARPDAVSTVVGRPVVVRVLGNDSAGSPAVPLEGSGVRLRLAGGLPEGSTLYGDAKTLVVPEGTPGPVSAAPGGGVFLVSGQGEITFVPIGDQPAPVLTVGYQVTDANGTRARSTLTVTVGR